jgi:hypothetical protein
MPTTVQEAPRTADHTHPDHTCPDCRAEENSTRWGFGPSYRELHPDYRPPNRGRVSRGRPS